MLVRQLIGPLAGEVVEMPYHVAQNCLAAGTVCLPDASPAVKGLRVEPESAPEPAPRQDVAEEPAAVDAATVEPAPSAPDKAPSRKRRGGRPRKQ